jgi:glycosyltransferase involved in cell wall biosynthesis
MGRGSRRPKLAAVPFEQARFVLVWNGAADSPPASGVRDFLLQQRARRVITVAHPLQREDDPSHRLTIYEYGRRVSERKVRLGARPPITYPLDALIPPWPLRGDLWIGFNNLMAARGLVQRGLGLVDKVVYWAVDFVPDRFGRGLLTKIYDRLDAAVTRQADLQIDLSPAALEGRRRRHRIAPGGHVAPIGAWLDRLPTTTADGWQARRIIFLGHLVPRQGVGRMIEALDLLTERGVEFEAEIAGHGPEEKTLKEQVARAGLADRVHFRGFLSDHRDVEAFVAAASVAVAPYDNEIESFTRYADPSKLRSYTAAGVPVVLTDVPPNARELAIRAGAEVVPYTAEGLADGIARALGPPEDWQRRRAEALGYSQAFDWSVIVSEALGKVGFRP